MQAFCEGLSGMGKGRCMPSSNRLCSSLFWSHHGSLPGLYFCMFGDGVLWLGWDGFHELHNGVLGDGVECGLDIKFGKVESVWFTGERGFELFESGVHVAY